jgi:hypothetical protein
MVTFAPMPNASEVIAAAVKAGDWRKNRNGSMA